MSYAVRVAADAADGDVIGSRATIAPGNGRSGAAQHRVVVHTSGLNIAESVDRDAAEVGEVLHYAITVSNTGAAAEDAVRVTSRLAKSCCRTPRGCGVLKAASDGSLYRSG